MNNDERQRVGGLLRLDKQAELVVKALQEVDVLELQRGARSARAACAIAVVVDEEFRLVVRVAWRLAAHDDVAQGPAREGEFRGHGLAKACGERGAPPRRTAPLQPRPEHLLQHTRAGTLSR